jgi:hypothetical protein
VEQSGAVSTSTISSTLAWVLVAHAAATWAMVGLIWFVQVAHYPLFALVGVGDFDRYESAHRWRTSFVVGPLMVVEGLAAVALVIDDPDVLTVAGLALLAGIHAVTAFVSVPCHDRLNVAFDDHAHRRLVVSNWWRTGGWTARGVLAAALLVQHLT